ncbi:site-specific integrase [Leptolyngbya sp. FACHB-711]|uniref:site-specific integrase n=1 Tax=unclassified Leptolyngbya TaxID=2650499 RepID=UPI00168397D6|nr:site-specific integrase [Leptolyngbya sp. FACHB-711]MBD1848890.1 site-specific integrase [Cyanobacteria bacterium FACHB-502]MBD2026004.1 site-specific integrase [Leptolyngbya sp. FACHB-711]
MSDSSSKDTDSSIDPRIEQANQRLKAARMGLQIERRGSKLCLRGTLPPRPGSDRLRAHQQRVPLDLPATPSGLKQAEQQVKVIAAQLIQNTFDWRQHLPVAGGKRLHQMDLAEKLKAFERHFLEHLAKDSNPGATRTTWEKTYAPYLRKLEATTRSHPNFTLTEAIYSTIQAIPANARSRQVCCTALNALAQFLHLELPIDLKTLWGTYSPSKTQMRRLPSDEEIIAIFDTIPSPTWQFVYGVMATYGLRNHEVFFCNYSALIQGEAEAAIEVLPTTKTGSHEVWPFYPEWVDRFNLREVRLPPLNLDLHQTTLQRIGQQVATQFRRYQIPFSPYDLRHAWAVRTIHFGIPDTVAARMMGHSVAIHNRTYHRWITRRDQQQAVQAALERRIIRNL